VEVAMQQTEGNKCTNTTRTKIKLSERIPQGYANDMNKLIFEQLLGHFAPSEKSLHGAQAAMARALGVSAMTISKWKAKDIPVRWAIIIEAITDKKFTRQQIRPDIFQA
jgi:hypothetical protein